MCNFCSKDIKKKEELLKRRIYLNHNEEFSKELHVMIDKGYLRMVTIDDLFDMNCGQKIKIKFCPMCGSEI